MEILVSLSASALGENDRVAVLTDAGWFIGTVTAVKKKYASVQFDDGDTAEVLKDASAREVKVLPAGTKKIKKALMLKDIKLLLAPKTATKTKAEKPAVRKPFEDEVIQEPVVKPLPVRPAPPRPTMRQIGVVAPPTSNTKHEEKEQPAVEHPTDPVEQMRIVYESKIRNSHDHAAIRRFMLDLWTALNRHKFDNRLRPIKKFLVIPANGRTGLRAFWHPHYRLIVFTDLVFKSRWDKFHEIYLHEMCHQAVTDLDYNGKPMVLAEGGHGPEWQAWMRKVGLEPKRYDDSTFKEYMTEDERELFEKNASHEMSEQALAIVRKKDHYDKIKAQRLPPVKNGQVGAYVVFSTGVTEEPLEGVITDYEEKNGHREYTVMVYIQELRTKDHVYVVRENDTNNPLHFMREPRLKYKAIARKLAEEARARGRKAGKAR